jgi:hypothetical protein
MREARRSARGIAAIAAGREHPGQRDEAWFKREIAPKLDAFSLGEIAASTRLSLAACSRIGPERECHIPGLGRGWLPSSIAERHPTRPTQLGL